MASGEVIRDGVEEPRTNLCPFLRIRVGRVGLEPKDEVAVEGGHVRYHVVGVWPVAAERILQALVSLGRRPRDVCEYCLTIQTQSTELTRKVKCGGVSQLTFCVFGHRLVDREEQVLDRDGYVLRCVVVELAKNLAVRLRLQVRLRNDLDPGHCAIAVIKSDVVAVRWGIVFVSAP